jgi:hypothetical protein
MLISESLWGVWNMILTQFWLQTLCRFGYTSWYIRCVPSKLFKVEAASCENVTSWAGNTNTYILCRYRPRPVTRYGCTPPTSPKGSFFYVANKIFVTCSKEAHNTLLMNCGTESILIFNVIFPQILNLTVLGILGNHLVCPYWLNAPDSLFLLCWHMLQKIQLMDL